MYFPKSVTLCEVGLRDGLQNEKTMLTTDQKLTLFEGIKKAGFKVIELGSFTHPKAIPQMADTDALFASVGQSEGPADALQADGLELRALVPNLRGVQRAIACGCKKAKLNVSASRMHNLKNLNRTPEETVAGFADCVAAAKEAGIDISGSISMPFSSPWEGRIPVEDVDKIIEAYLAVGITEISLSDASGMAVPTQVHELCTHVLNKYPQASWWLHFHNTRGMALANITAAMDAGMTRFDSSLGGIGGCPYVPGAAGNISSEDLVHFFDECGIETGIDVMQVMETSRLLKQMLGREQMDSYVLKAGTNAQLIEARKNDLV